MRVLITGGTGLIGRVLCRVLLKDGHEVIVLSRSPQSHKFVLPPGVELHAWDGISPDGWGHLIHSDTTIINLAGGRSNMLHWRGADKQHILNSRIAAAQAVAQAIENAPEKPRVLLQASAVGYYGDCESDIVVEDSPVGEGWRAEICHEWEQATARLDVRQCILRFGLVLDTHSGALPSMLLGSGFRDEQYANDAGWIPWVHNHDVALSLKFLLNHEQASGPFNIASPNPQTSCHFIRTLSDTIKTTSLIPVPEATLQQALGETEVTALDSQRVIPYNLSRLGYKFRFPSLEDAFRHLVNSYS